MNRIFVYMRESYEELIDHVSWPKWSQLQQSTLIVLGATLMIIGIVAIMDFVSSGALKFIYSIFK